MYHVRYNFPRGCERGSNKKFFTLIVFREKYVCRIKAVLVPDIVIKGGKRETNNLLTDLIRRKLLSTAIDKPTEPLLAMNDRRLLLVRSVAWREPI